MTTLDDHANKAMRRQQLGYTLAIVTISAVALASNTERALFGGPAVPAAFAALPGAADGAVSQNGFVAGGPRDGSFGAASGFPRRGASVGPVSGLPARLAGVPAGSVPTGSVSGDDAAAAAPDGAAPTVLADNGPVASRGGIASFADGAGGLPALGGLLSGGGGGGGTSVVDPTPTPTPAPSATPTPTPTAAPTASPTSIPTPVPSGTPTPLPTDTATPVPGAVPEAATWAMLVAGFALVGSAMRRRRFSMAAALFLRR